MRTIPSQIQTLLKSKSMIGDNAPQVKIIFPDYPLLSAYISSINIDREEAADSQRCQFIINNVNPSDPTDTGYYSPYRSYAFGKTPNAWANVLIPSRVFQIEIGYGAYTEVVFTGEIDDVVISAKPRNYTIKIDSRCLGCRLVDQQVKLSNYTTDETHAAGGFALSNQNIVYKSDAFYNAAAFGGTHWINGTNYTIDLVTGIVTNINMTGTVYCNYCSDAEYYIEYPLPSGGISYWLALGGSIPDISDIVKDLCLRAGFVDLDVIVETTGITLDPYWEKRTYMDCINDLCTASGFIFYIDEDGLCHFEQQKNRQVVTDETHAAGGFALAHVFIMTGGEFYSGAGKTGTHWINGTNYTIDLVTGIVTNINMTGTVYCNYTYAAWKFQEGEDIFSLDLTISRRNVYGSIYVEGDGDVSLKPTSTPLFDGANIRLDKVMFAGNQYLDDPTKVDSCANKMNSDMLNRYICCDFEVIGNAWIQVGDNIMIVESSSTISEVYKVLSTNLTINALGFNMSMKTFHIGG